MSTCESSCDLSNSGTQECSGTPRPLFGALVDSVSGIDAIVLHSGGMDSSICLYLAVKRFGKDRVLSLGFDYGQRHGAELAAAETIAGLVGVRRRVVKVPDVIGWEDSSLLSKRLSISNGSGIPNSFVPARNGLFLLMASPLAKQVGAQCLYIGVMELEGANSGYPDCSRAYIDAVQTVIRLDLQDPQFLIETPLIRMTKRDTIQLAHDLKILDLLLEHTVTCYEGLRGDGCKLCPACKLRNEGVREFFGQ
jgi:7-cyano-7-deazaguanine synthase